MPRTPLEAVTLAASRTLCSSGWSRVNSGSAHPIGGFPSFAAPDLPPSTFRLATEGSTVSRRVSQPTGRCNWSCRHQLWLLGVPRPNRAFPSMGSLSLDELYAKATAEKALMLYGSGPAAPDERMAAEFVAR